jgi:beta-lactamase class C
LAPGVLGEEAYGVRTSVADLTRFMEVNMGRIKLNAHVAEAITSTHVGYFQLGAMTQALVWEEYDYPVTLRDLLAGNSAEVAYKPNRVARISPPSAHWKTYGSTRQDPRTASALMWRTRPDQG